MPDVPMRLEASYSGCPRLLPGCAHYCILFFRCHAFVAFATFTALWNFVFSVVVAFTTSLVTTVISTLHVSRIMMSRESLAGLVFPRSMDDQVQPFKRKSVEN
jgi:hypothetical protein